MRIILTIHTTMNPNSGSSGAIYRLGKAYEQLGHEVQIYSLSDLPKQLPIQAACLLFPWFTARMLLQQMRQHPVDVVDASTSDGWVWGLGHRRHPRPLYVTHSHGLEHGLNQAMQQEAAIQGTTFSWKYHLYWNGFHLWEVVRSLRQADLAIFLNSTDRDYALQHFGLQPDRSRVLGQGIPETLLNLPWMATSLEPDAPLWVACIGNYIPSKGVQYIAAAMPVIMTQYPFVKLRFLGTGVLSEQVLKDYPHELHPRIQVIPQFEQSQLPKLLQDCQIKLFATLYDGFGLALLEAMACGLTAIVTATPGPLSLVRHQENGLVVPVRDVQAIVNALEQLLRDRPWLDRLRQQAYRDAQNYGWLRIAQQRLKLYEEFLAKPLQITGSASSFL